MKRENYEATDISWNTKVEDCPNFATVILRYTDGSFELVQADDNDTEWSEFYPKTTPKHLGIAYPEAWALVSSERNDEQ